MVAVLLLASFRVAYGASLVSNGQPKAVIVAGTEESNRFAAAELQRYFEAFTGTKLEIVNPEEARRRSFKYGLGVGRWATGQ